MSALCLSSAIKKRGGKFTVKLSSAGNPDCGQDPDISLCGVLEATAHVETIDEARSICRQYIERFNIGGGNWTGGELVRADGVVVGKFSYNGRLWAEDGNEVEK